MANYLQAIGLLGRGEKKRCWYVCGAERPLVEEIVAAIERLIDPHDLDYAILSAGRTSDADVWAHANQYPLVPERHRLVIVRDAEKIRDWRQLGPWLDSRHIPQNHVLFVSNEEDVERDEDQAMVAEHVKRIAKTGRFVRCSPLTRGEWDWRTRSRTTDEAARYVESRHPRFSTALAAHLLDRTASNLSAALNVARMTDYLEGEVTEMTIDALARESPARTFVQELSAMRKPRALEVLEEMDESDYGRAIGELDFRLDALSRIHREQKKHSSTQALAKQTGVENWLVREMKDHAKHYDATRVLRDVNALARADAQLHVGSATGVMEALVAKW